jgi:hypothetical protein
MAHTHAVTTAQAASITTTIRTTTMGGKMTAEDWLTWVDRAYFGAAIIAAVATAITAAASRSNRAGAVVPIGAMTAPSPPRRGTRYPEVMQ